MADGITVDPLDIAEDVILITEIGASFPTGSKGAAAVQLGARLGAIAIAALRKLADEGIDLEDFRVPATLDEHVAKILAERGLSEPTA